MLRVILGVLLTITLFPQPVGPAQEPITIHTQAVPSRGGEARHINNPEKITCEASAYTWTGHHTASGTWPDEGTVSIDPRVIPLGSKLYIEGYGYAVAEDTGGAIRGNKIDVYFPDRDACIRWGRQEVEVIILERGN